MTSIEEYMRYEGEEVSSKDNKTGADGEQVHNGVEGCSEEAVIGQSSEIECPGRKRRLVTISQWDCDARKQMLKTLQYSYDVT